MNAPVKYDFPSHYKGDKLESFTVSLKYPLTGDPIDLTGATVTCALKSGTYPAYTFSSLSEEAEKQLTILDDGVIQFPHIRSWDLQVNKYDYALKAVFPNGDVQTYLYGYWPEGVGGGGCGAPVYPSCGNGNGSAGDVEIIIEENITNIVVTVDYQQKGDPGKSAYQYAVDGGYTGTEEEFSELLAKPRMWAVIYNPILMKMYYWGGTEYIEFSGGVTPIPDIWSDSSNWNDSQNWVD